MNSFNDFIIDTKVLKQNALNIKNLIGNNVKLCAVVKANAYGIGVNTVCKTVQNIVDFYAVANLKEALNIRVFDKKTKILILGLVKKEYLKICSENNISISICSLEQLENYFDNIDSLINVHLQINTGLNRFGFRSLNEFKKAIKILNLNKNCNIEGIYSHFATKENDVFFIKKQYIRFVQFKKCIKNPNVISHIANSYATIYDNKFHNDMIRTGFLLYGAMKNNIGNKLILSIKSHVVHIFNVRKNDTIGYDRTFKAKNNMKIAVVPIGYADGYDRRLSNKFYVLIKGCKCPIVGMICMDVMMVDISDLNINLGEEVVLLGKQKEEYISLQDMASILNTSPYEVLLKFQYKRMNQIVK